MKLSHRNLKKKFTEIFDMSSTNKLTRSIATSIAIVCSTLGAILVTIDRSPAESILTINWMDSVNHLRLESRIGRVFTFMCPANGSIAEITGTNVYATSSSICTAATHMGTIKAATGGMIKIKIQPEADAYQSSTQNGIKSNSNGPPVYNTSFIILDAEGRTLPIKKAAKKTKQDTGF
jgi:LCCL domain